MCLVCYCLCVPLQLWDRLFVQQCDWVLFSYLMHREREMRKGDKRVAPLYCVIWYVVAWGLSLSSFPPLMFVCDEPCLSCHSWPGRYLIQFSLHKAILNRQYLCHITVVACGSKGPIRKCVYATCQRMHRVVVVAIDWEDSQDRRRRVSYSHFIAHWISTLLKFIIWQCPTPYHHPRYLLCHLGCALFYMRRMSLSP